MATVVMVNMIRISRIIGQTFRIGRAILFGVILYKVPRPNHMVETDPKKSGLKKTLP